MIGNFDDVKEMFSLVNNQNSVSLLQKRRVYQAFIRSQIALGDFTAAELCCIQILGELNCQFPKRLRSLHVFSFFLVLKFQRTKVLSKLNHLKLCDCEEKIWTVDLLDQLATILYHSDQKLLPLVVFRGFEYTVRYGSFPK